eukprot:TRINITY_DN4521_c0_g1_i3.p1 TRINITY_DN4521_c0_g1~~TRINITY_DN4521_c0_g1_i3.p1  ORF type:complete len:310 (+),score=84.54 TRINITY_DN4521_c0_g1_i3:26-931(+)
MSASQEDTAIIGIIGGTGVYNLAGLSNTREIEVSTPFGAPSSHVHLGTLDGVKIAFIARHGVGHRLIPSEVPFRANIYALKSLGVQYLLSFGACGSLQEDLRPLDIVLVDQFLDRTKGIRHHTFFGEGVVAHVPMGEPVCSSFVDAIDSAVKESDSELLKGLRVHRGGTYVCMEGPAFSTKAESNMYRMLGGSVIGMTGIPEALLAREAEIAYAMVALVTDYDCWHPNHADVTVDMVMATLKQNSATAQALVAEVIRRVGKAPFESAAHSALKYAILTPTDRIGDDTKTRLHHIISKYLQA